MSKEIVERIEGFNEKTRDEIESETIKLIPELGGLVTKNHEIGTIVFSDDSSGVRDVYLGPEGIGYGQYRGDKFFPNISTEKFIGDVYKFGTDRFPLLPFLKALERVREAYTAE